MNLLIPYVGLQTIKKSFLLSSNFHPTPAGCSEHTLILLKLVNTLDKIGQVLTIQAQVPTLSKKTWVYTTKLPKFSNIVIKKITQSNNFQGCLYYLRCVSEAHARIKIKSSNYINKLIPHFCCQEQQY